MYQNLNPPYSYVPNGISSPSNPYNFIPMNPSAVASNSPHFASIPATCFILIIQPISNVRQDHQTSDQQPQPETSL